MTKKFNLGDIVSVNNSFYERYFPGEIRKGKKLYNGNWEVINVYASYNEYSLRRNTQSLTIPASYMEIVFKKIKPKKIKVKNIEYI